MRNLFIALIVALSAALSPIVNAFEVVVDGGITNYLRAPCGNWFQCTDSTPYTLRMKSLSGSIGIYTDQFAGGWQLGGGVGNAGRFTSDAIIHNIDNCLTGCGPLSHMQGQGAEPFAFIGVRKTIDKWFIEGDLYVTRMSYENTNFDWFGPPPNYQVGPIISHIDHAVVNSFSPGLTVGYQVNESFSLVGKIIPTHATNSQYDPISGQQTWYRPIASSAAGVSPFVGIEWKF